MNFYKNINFKKNKIIIQIIILFLIFNFLNFSSIASYLILILSIAAFYNSKINVFQYKKEKYYKLLISMFFIITSLFSIYFYIIYFSEEHKLYINKSYETNNYLLKAIESENKEKNIFKNHNNNIERLCENLIEYSKSAENYIYC
jgi:hypothetical protein